MSPRGIGSRATLLKGDSAMSVLEHKDNLVSKNAALEKAIEEENNRPYPDEIRLHALKREKLRIKDQIHSVAALG